jgi:hypothetical protein
VSIEQLVSELEEAVRRTVDRDDVARSELLREMGTNNAVSREDVERVQQRLGVTFPSEFLELLKLRNGILLPDVNGYTSWIRPLHAIYRTKEAWPELLAEIADYSSSEPFVPLAMLPSRSSVLHDDLPDVSRLEWSLLLTPPSESPAGLFLVPFFGFSGPMWEVWLLEPHGGCIRFASLENALKYQIERCRE